MSEIRWVDLLGWSEDEISDLRFVGYSYLRQGHYTTALKFFEALVVLCPKSVYDIQIVGALHLEMGDNLRALNSFDQALKLDPTHGPTLLNRAKALLVLGYQKQGLTQAAALENHEDPKIKGQAGALILAYS